jgi:hypothetical protein
MSRSRRIETENHVKDLIKDELKAYYPGTWSYAPIQTGMGEHGIHDRIACVPLKVTPEMVGKTIGVFVSIEAKKPGRRGEPDRGMSKHQARNLRLIREAGGFSICCDGYEDLAELDDQIKTFQHRV